MHFCHKSFEYLKNCQSFQETGQYLGTIGSDSKRCPKSIYSRYVLKSDITRYEQNNLFTEQKCSSRVQESFSVDEDEMFIPTSACTLRTELLTFCQLFLRRHFKGQTGKVKIRQQLFLRSPILPKYSEVKPWDCSGLHPQVGQVSRQGVKDGEYLLDHCQLAVHEGNAMTSLLKCRT